MERVPGSEDQAVDPTAPAAQIDTAGWMRVGFSRRRLSIGTIFVTVFLIVLALAMFAAVYRPFAVVLALSAAVVALAWFGDRRSRRGR
jgi:hypothetical protein